MPLFDFRQAKQTRYPPETNPVDEDNPEYIEELTDSGDFPTVPALKPDEDLSSTSLSDDSDQSETIEETPETSTDEPSLETPAPIPHSDPEPNLESDPQKQEPIADDSNHLSFKNKLIQTIQKNSRNSWNQKRPALKSLKRFREFHRLTQKDMAAVLGISPQYYSLIERGKNTLSVKRAILLAKFLEVSVEELFTEDLQAYLPGEKLRNTHDHSEEV